VGVPGLEEIRDARRDLDAVIEQIQAVPGFEDFLAPPTFEDVAAAAAQRPLVYVTPASPGGIALIVRSRDVAHVPLPALTVDAVRDRVAPYLEAYRAYGADRKAGRDGWNAALDDITAWLWDAAMAPVLAELKDSRELVLVAGGLLGLLPLHAAWTEDAGTPTGRRYAIDAAAISYAPNARALGAAARAATDMQATRLLAIVDPQPVAAPALSFAPAEGAVAAAAFQGAATVLPGGEATVMAFNREAPKTDVLHLACHGLADLERPLESGLLLAGNQWVTLRDLLGMELDVRLAVLSACETSLPGTELPDEVVALPTGLLQAGVAGVIASQWAVPDLATTILMTEFYRHRAELTPAAALRRAQRWMRDTTNARKLEEWRTARADGAAWLPPDTADALIDRLRFRAEDALDDAGIRSWAAFAHVGV
jgi:CHAT domain-containing protein